MVIAFCSSKALSEGLWQTPEMAKMFHIHDIIMRTNCHGHMWTDFRRTIQYLLWVLNLLLCSTEGLEDDALLAGQVLQELSGSLHRLLIDHPVLSGIIWPHEHL